MLTYLSVIGFALYHKYNILGAIDFQSLILGILISVWSLRLGIFLFYRIYVGDNKIPQYILIAL